MEKAEIELKKLEADLDKVLIEKLKLQKDLDSYDERFEIERKKVYSDRNRFWAETFRLLLIALVTSGATYLINKTIEERKKNNEVTIEDYKSFKEDKKSFNNSSIGFAEKKKLACGMNEDYADLEIKKVQDFLQEIVGLCNDSVIQENQAIINAGLNKIKVDTALKKEFANAERRNNEIQQKLAVAKGEEKSKLVAEQKKAEHTIDSLASLPQVNILSTASQAITKDINEQAKIINDAVKESKTDDKVEDGYPKTLWFKKNYFLVIDDMKIVLEDILENGSIEVSMCNSISSEICPDNLKIDLSKYANTIRSDRPIEVVQDGYKYIIRLDHIGNAGKNPFTRAAYITIEKYKVHI